LGVHAHLSRTLLGLLRSLLGLEPKVRFELTLFLTRLIRTQPELRLSLSGRFVLLLGSHAHFCCTLTRLLASLLGLESHFACALTGGFLCLECAKSKLRLLQPSSTIRFESFTGLLERSL
jgi:hypothetical protein